MKTLVKVLVYVGVVVNAIDFWITVFRGASRIYKWKNAHPYEAQVIMDTHNFVDSSRIIYEKALRFKTT